MTCGKRRYTSATKAKRGHGRQGFRVRAYWCVDCGAYHCTARDKR